MKTPGAETPDRITNRAARGVGCSELLARRLTPQASLPWVFMQADHDSTNSARTPIHNKPPHIDANVHHNSKPLRQNDFASHLTTVIQKQTIA
jgi:hypothetical protein